MILNENNKIESEKNILSEEIKLCKNLKKELAEKKQEDSPIEIIQKLLEELESITDKEERDRKKWLIFEELEKPIQVGSDWRIKKAKEYNELENKFTELVKNDNDVSFLDQNIFSYNNRNIIKYYELYWIEKESIRTKIIELYNKNSNKNKEALWNFLIPLWQCYRIFGWNDKELYEMADKIISKKEEILSDNNSLWASFLFGEETNWYSFFHMDPKSKEVSDDVDIKIFKLWEEVVLYKDKNNYIKITKEEYEKNRFKRWEYLKTLWVNRYEKEKKFEEWNEKSTNYMKEQFKQYWDITITEVTYLESDTYWDIEFFYNNDRSTYQVYKNSLVKIKIWKWLSVDFPFEESMTPDKIYKQIKITNQVWEILEKYKVSSWVEANIEYLDIVQKPESNWTYIFEIFAIKNPSSKYEQEMDSWNQCKPDWTVNTKLELKISPNWYEIKSDSEQDENSNWTIKNDIIKKD